MPVPVEEVVRAALTSTKPAEVCGRVLEIVRGRLAADAALLLRSGSSGTGSISVHRAAGPGVTATVAGELLAPAFSHDDPVEIQTPGGETVLALSLQPPDDVPWCLAVLRHRGQPWTPAEHDAVASLRPLVTLVLAQAIARQQLAEERARQADAAGIRERLLNVLSHELRNPLAPILMWTSTLKRLRQNDGEVLRAAQAIDHAVAIERRLIEDLLDLSRLERGVLTLSPEPLDLCELVRKTAELHRLDAERAQLALVLDLPPSRAPVYGDPVRLAQLTDNLVGNALKFTPPGGTVIIRLRRRGDQAELDVSDTGPGIPPDVAERVFTPFVQGANAHGGLGIGLAVARWLVDLHGGTIEATPRGEHGGATLVVRLPVDTAGARATRS